MRIGGGGPSWDLRDEQKHPRKREVGELASGRQSNLRSWETDGP